MMCDKEVRMKKLISGKAPTLDWLRARRDAILALAEEHGAENVRVFGSVARGEATSTSDIDLLVTFRAGTSLWDAVGLWQDLSAFLGCEVSLIGDDNDPRRQRFLRRARQEAVPL
jgi:uncharacterized protein